MKSRPCVLSFSLSCLSYGCFPSKSLLSRCPILFLSPTLCLFVSLFLCLAVFHPFLISPFGPPAAAAGKVLSLLPPHFLLLHSQRLFFWSHISFLFIHRSSQLTSLLVYSSLYSIVHHGTTLTQTQLNLKFRSSTVSHTYHLIFCANHRLITEKNIISTVNVNAT